MFSDAIRKEVIDVKKKFFILFFSFLGFLLVPFSNAFATVQSDFENGLMDSGISYTITAPGDKGDLIFDNDLSTYISLTGDSLSNRQVTIIFDEPLDLIKYINNQSGGFLVYYFYDENGTLLASYNINSNLVREVDLKGVKKVIIRNTSQSTVINLYEVDFSSTLPFVYSDVANLFVVNDGLDNTISFDTSNVSDGYTGAEVYRNNELITTLDSSTTSYIDSVDSYNTTYSYKVVALYGTNKSSGLMQSVTTGSEPVIPPPADRDGDGIPDSEDAYPDDPTNTPPPASPEDLPEVKNLTVKSTDKRADLSWDNPPKYFDKAIIYRKTLGTNETASIMDLFGPMKVYAATDGDYEPLFETNGTTFSDLTVKEQTDYEYKVTTEWNGMESDGVIVKTATPKKPIVDLSEAELPFGATELIKSGNGLLYIVGSLILLGLSFILVPKIIALLRGANSSTNNGASLQHNERVRVGKQPKVTERQLNMALGNGRKKREGRVPRLTERQARGG